MRRILITAALAATTLALAAGPATAAGKSGSAPGQNKDLFIACYDGTLVIPGVCGPTSSPGPSTVVSNLGQAIAAGFYGNTANDGANGNGVIPSVSPGPATGGCAGVVPGASLGDVISGNSSGPSGKTDPAPC